ncbi:MAG: response regulator [Acidobacteria bacterium]|nr:response regulator [Acidobacteriota bacterium]
MATGRPVLTILVVECAEIRALLRLMLEREGYRVLQSDTEHAAAVLKQEENEIHALITNTPQLFLRFASLPILYIAAIPDPEITPYCTAVLRKPFTCRALAESVEKVLASAEIPGKPPSRECTRCNGKLRAASGQD